MTTTFCISGAVLMKAGAGISSQITSGVKTIDGTTYIIDGWINEAECIINSVCRYNFIDNYGNLNIDVKYILRDLSSAMAAINCITYDMSGYTNLREAENIINVLRDGVLRNLSILKDKKVQDFINGS
jgi:hypothetical protein